MVELFDPTFIRSQFMKKVETEDGTQLDYFDTRIVDLVKKIDRIDSFSYMYDGSEHIENIAYKFYSSTSLWWVLMEYNGFSHPLEIKEGEVLRVPPKAEIDAIISNNLPKNRRGRRRTI